MKFYMYPDDYFPPHFHVTEKDLNTVLKINFSFLHKILKIYLSELKCAKKGRRLIGYVAAVLPSVQCIETSDFLVDFPLFLSCT